MPQKQPEEVQPPGNSLDCPPRCPWFVRRSERYLPSRVRKDVSSQVEPASIQIATKVEQDLVATAHILAVHCHPFCGKGCLNLQAKSAAFPHTTWHGRPCQVLACMKQVYLVRLNPHSANACLIHKHLQAQSDARWMEIDLRIWVCSYSNGPPICPLSFGSHAERMNQLFGQAVFQATDRSGALMLPDQWP